MSMVSDFTTLLEIARVALVLYPEQMGDELDLSDDEIKRLHEMARKFLWEDRDDIFN